MSKVGIKETSEVFDFLTKAVSDIDGHKDDDGKISSLEWAQVVMTNAPGALAAVRGIDQIDDEIKDLDEAEAKELAGKGMALAMAVMDLLGVAESEQD